MNYKILFGIETILNSKRNYSLISLDMNLYRKLYCPYTRGLRGRDFLSEFKKRKKKNRETKDKRRFDPEWNKDKIINES